MINFFLMVEGYKTGGMKGALTAISTFDNFSKWCLVASAFFLLMFFVLLITGIPDFLLGFDVSWFFVLFAVLFIIGIYQARKK
jgi:hypothetical protein